MCKAGTTLLFAARAKPQELRRLKGLRFRLRSQCFCLEQSSSRRFTSAHPGFSTCRPMEGSLAPGTGPGAAWL